MDTLYKSDFKIPLAERMRPKTIEEFVGQSHIVGKNMLLRRAIQANSLGSCIFYGPPGCGKTTLANIIANTSGSKFEKLNAVSSGVAEAKKIIDKARQDANIYGIKTYLLLDECHRWNKAQSDCVLEAIEDGSIIFIGSTTENPYINMTRAIVSRCRIFEFKPLSNNDIISMLDRAIVDKEKGLGQFNINITQEAKEHIAKIASGDLRQALNALELAALTTPPQKGKINIDLQVAEQCIQKKALSLNEDVYFDILSAFCKSLRGSDTEAALYYSNRLIEAGCDPKIIARRMIAHASEDIGMADSNALLLACSAMYAVEKIGPPECYLNLAHAIIYICEAEKSNSVYLALQKAKDDAINNKDDNIPNNLKNHPSINADGTGSYKYPHDFGGYVKQQYLPNSLKDRVYYVPSKNGREKNLVRKKNMNKDLPK